MDLEGLATEILVADRKDSGHGFGFFTPEQYEYRLRREVYSEHPIDPLHFSGLYRRAYRADDERPTRRTGYKSDPWAQEYFDSSGDGSAGGVWLPSSRRDIVVGGQHYVTGPTRDPLFPACSPLGHLDRYQRCRIRAALRGRGSTCEQLARHYGVPLGVIERIEEQMSDPRG